MGEQPCPSLRTQQSTLRRSPSSESFLGSESSYLSSMSAAPSRDGSDQQAEASGDTGGDSGVRVTSRLSLPLAMGTAVPWGSWLGAGPIGEGCLQVFQHWCPALAAVSNPVSAPRGWRSTGSWCQRGHSPAVRCC